VYLSPLKFKDRNLTAFPSNIRICSTNMGMCEPGELRRYSDWLRAGRSGDRIPVGARFSAPVQTGPGANPASCTMCTGSFSGIESGRGVTLSPHPLLVLRSKNRVGYTSTLPKGIRGL
jgi:hypothetical protein